MNLHLENYDMTKQYYVKISNFIYKLIHNQNLIKEQIVLNMIQRSETRITDDIQIIDYNSLYESRDHSDRSKIILLKFNSYYCILYLNQKSI